MGATDVEKVVGRGTREITLPSGEAVRVDICKVRHLGRVTKIIAAMVALVKEGQASGQVAQDDISGMLGDPKLMLMLIERLTDDVFGLASLLSSLTIDQVNELLPDDAVILLSAILEDNYSFFMEKVLPNLQKVLPAGVVPTQTQT